MDYKSGCIDSAGAIDGWQPPTVLKLLLLGSIKINSFIWDYKYYKFVKLN
jgi:hypothetical protein